MPWHGPILHRLDLPRKAQVGQAIMEFMLIMPLLFVIVAAVWEYGRVFDAQLVATNAAREGARFASANTTTTFNGCNTCLTPETISRVQNDVVSGYGYRLVSFNGTAYYPNGDVKITSVDVCYIDDAQGTNSCLAGSPQGPVAGGRVLVIVHGEVRVFMPFLPLLNKDPYKMTAYASMLQQ